MVDWDDVGDEGGCGEEDMETGSLAEAEVVGLMSWVGEGARFSEADCRVDAISIGTVDMVNAVD